MNALWLLIPVAVVLAAAFIGPRWIRAAERREQHDCPLCHARDEQEGPPC